MFFLLIAKVSSVATDDCVRFKSSHFVELHSAIMAATVLSAHFQAFVFPQNLTMKKV